MKLLLALVLLLICIVLFTVGVFSPSRSKKMQGQVDQLAKRGERKTDQKAGAVGDATRAALERSRKAADASGRAGRRVHEKATRDDESRT